MYFGNYRLRKTWLDKSLKRPVISEHPSKVKVNMIKGSKHCLNLHDTFIIFFHHS